MYTLWSKLIIRVSTGDLRMSQRTQKYPKTINSHTMNSSEKKQQGPMHQNGPPRGTVLFLLLGFHVQ